MYVQDAVGSADRFQQGFTDSSDVAGKPVDCSVVAVIDTQDAVSSSVEDVACSTEVLLPERSRCRRLSLQLS